MTVLGLLVTLNIMVGFIMIHLWTTKGYENRILDIKDLLIQQNKLSEETNRNIRNMDTHMEQERIRKMKDSRYT